MIFTYSRDFPLDQPIWTFAFNAGSSGFCSPQFVLIDQSCPKDSFAQICTYIAISRPAVNQTIRGIYLGNMIVVSERLDLLIMRYLYDICNAFIKQLGVNFANPYKYVPFDKDSWKWLRLWMSKLSVCHVCREGLNYAPWPHRTAVSDTSLACFSQFYDFLYNHIYEHRNVSGHLSKHVYLNEKNIFPQNVTSIPRLASITAYC